MSHSSWLVWVWEPRKFQAFESDLAGHLCGSLAILVCLAEGLGNAIMSIIGSSVGYKTARCMLLRRGRTTMWQKKESRYQ